MGIIQSTAVHHEQRPIAGKTISVAVVARLDQPSYPQVFWRTIFGLLKGMKLTLGVFSSPKQIVTRQYPENRATLHLTERFRGNLRFKFPNTDARERHQAYVEKLAVEAKVSLALAAEWSRDDNPDRWYHNCTGCKNCEVACPNASIKVMTRENKFTEDREVEQFIWRLDSCMFCNACVQACPWDAIEMTGGFENAVYDRRLLVYNLNHLAAPRINMILDEPSLEIRDQMIEPRERFSGPIPLNGQGLPNLLPVLADADSSPTPPATATDKAAP